MAFSIAHDQDPDFVVGVTAFAGFFRSAASQSWRAFERPRALVRSAYERLIRLGNTRQSLGMHGHRRSLKQVAPAKSRIAMNAGCGGRGAHARAVDQGLGEDVPGIAMTQPGKGRAGQCVKHAATSVAFVASEAAGMTKAHAGTSRTVRTTQYAERVQRVDDSRCRISACQSDCKPLFLRCAQRRKTGQLLVKIGFFMQSTVPTITQRSLVRGIVPFIIADIVRLALLASVPILTLWLPSTMFGIFDCAFVSILRVIARLFITRA